MNVSTSFKPIYTAPHVSKGLFAHRNSTGAYTGNNDASRAPVQQRLSPSPAGRTEVRTSGVQGSLDRGGATPSQHCSTYEGPPYCASDVSDTPGAVGIETRDGRSLTSFSQLVRQAEADEASYESRRRSTRLESNSSDEEICGTTEQSDSEKNSIAYPTITVRVEGVAVLSGETSVAYNLEAGAVENVVEVCEFFTKGRNVGDHFRKGKFYKNRSIKRWRIRWETKVPPHNVR